MELIYSPASPFVRKVLVTAHETGMFDRLQLTPVATTALNTAPEAAAANPLGKIPALVRPDGTALYDSRVICRYLNCIAGADLYPQAREWETLTLEATGHGISESAVSMVYERRLRPEQQQSEDWIEAQWAKVCGALDALEARWMSHLFGRMDAGHIAVMCALGYLDFRHSDRAWRDTRPGLAGWYTKMAERPAMRDTHPEG